MQIRRVNIDFQVINSCRKLLHTIYDNFNDAIIYTTLEIEEKIKLRSYYNTGLNLVERIRRCALVLFLRSLRRQQWKKKITDYKHRMGKEKTKKNRNGNGNLIILTLLIGQETLLHCLRRGSPITSRMFQRCHISCSLWPLRFASEL